jgi:hypothetical protein
VSQKHCAKILGVMFDDNQCWSSQIKEVGGVLSSLNSRLFTIKRLSSAVRRERIERIADSLYISKLKYGLKMM